MTDPSHIDCPIRAHATSHPDAPAITGPRGTITWCVLDRHVSLASALFLERGMRSGDRLGLYTDNDISLLIALWAGLRAGITVVPVSTRMPADAAKKLTGSIGIDAVVSDHPVFKEARITITPEEVCGDTGLTRPGDHLPPERLVADTTRSDARDVLRFPTDQIWTGLFTSGSSGVPKAILHTLGAHVQSAIGSETNIPVTPGDRWLLSLPLYHVGGFAIPVRCWFAGASVVLPDDNSWDADFLRDREVTHVSLVSTQLRRLVERLRNSDPLPSLKAVLLGGSHIPESLIREAVTINLPVHVSYGSTEMASQIATSAQNWSVAELSASSGKILPYRSVRIAADGGVFVRGDTRFSGYATASGMSTPFDAEGWYETGDIAEWKGRARLRIIGRKDQMFISGGENIHPEVIERALLAIDGVREAIVVSVPDAEFGERPAAFVDIDNPIRISTLEANLRQELPGFMIPVFFKPFPERPSGLKPNRQQLASFAQAIRKI